MKKSILLLIAVSAVISTSCSSDYEIHKVGENFKIRLEKEAAGGYLWKMKPDSLVKVVKETSESIINDSTKLNEYVKIFEIKPEKTGTTRLEFYRKRNFEPDSMVTKDKYFYKKIKIK